MASRAAVFLAALLSAPASAFVEVSAPRPATELRASNDPFPYHSSFLDASRAYFAIATALEATPESVDAVEAAEAAFQAPSSPGSSAAAAAPKKTRFVVPRELGLVRADDASVQFAAGTLGAGLGLLVGGPVLAALLGCGLNYLSRKGEEGAGVAGEYVGKAAAGAVGAYNSLAELERGGGVLEKALGFLEGAVDDAKDSRSTAGQALEKAEDVLGGVAKQIGDLDEQYDFVGGAGTLLNQVGDLVEIGIDKARDAVDELL